MKKLLSKLLMFCAAGAALIGLSAKAQQGEFGLRVGDKAPDFTLTDASGKKVTLSEMLKEGPVVLTWYRGGWCPYCNVALKALSDVLPAIKGQGAQLVAMTPELPDHSMSTKEKNAVTFPVLSDIDNKVAQQYKLVFTLDAATAQRYESKFGLSKYNGNKKNQLPIPACYVIDKGGIIRFAYVNPDYRQRVKPMDVLQALQLVNMANSNKLAVLWTSDDPMLSERFVAMFPFASKRAGWFDEVDIIVWGPSNKLIAENEAIQAKVKAMQAAGVKFYSCLACSDMYGTTAKLRSLGIDVKYMGKPLAAYLKQGYRVLEM